MKRELNKTSYLWLKYQKKGGYEPPFLIDLNNYLID